MTGMTRSLDAAGDDLIPRAKLLIAAGVMIFCSICAFSGITQTPIDDHEAYVSVTAREMMQSHSYCVPTMNGETRIRKPPLQYWLVVAAASVTGKVDELSVRLPSAVAAILMAAMLMYFVNKWLRFRIAALSAMMWSISFSFLTWAHNGRAEMVLTFLTAMSLFCFYDLAQEENRRRQIVLSLCFWVSFAFANLAKGPVPIFFVIPPMVAYALIYKKWGVFSKMLPIVGGLIFLAITVPWPVAIIETVPNWAAVWRRQSIERYAGAGKNGPFYYLGQMFVVTAPFTGFVLASLIAPFLKQWWDKRRHIMYMWLVFVLGIVIMSFSGGKQRHYILPVVPAMMVLCAIVFDELVFVRMHTTAKFARDFFLGHLAVFAVLIAIAPFLVYRGQRDALPEMLLVCTAGAVWVAASTILYRRGRFPVFTASIFIGYAACTIALNILIMGPRDSFAPIRQSAVRLRSTMPADKKLVSYRSIHPAFVHYFGEPVPCAKSEPELVKWYNDGAYVILEANAPPAFAAMNKVMELPEFSSKGRTVPVTVYHRAD
jgi:4-amino-4-deoxy-L-arabinose transferase-like glycosyltransferase